MVTTMSREDIVGLKFEFSILSSIYAVGGFSASAVAASGASGVMPAMWNIATDAVEPNAAEKAFRSSCDTECSSRPTKSSAMSLGRT